MNVTEELLAEKLAVATKAGVDIEKVKHQVFDLMNEDCRDCIMMIRKKYRKCNHCFWVSY